ncbi:MAG: GatB/YqeY domain-containing protein [Thermotogaceae bacterium]|nr:GatB/YqeY domain-containing protein [Thermotogaceae bacterium]
MQLKQRLYEDLKKAMKTKDEIRTRTLRLIISSIKTLEVEKMTEATDDDVFRVLSKECRKRVEAIEAYKKGGREDLVNEEQRELEIIKSYMPKQLSEEELKEIVKNVVGETGSSSIKDLGRVMKVLMPRVKGRADGKTVNNIVRQILLRKEDENT